MRQVKASAWVVAGVMMLAATITGVASPAHAASSYRLFVSTHKDRSHAVALNKATIKGSVYIFALPASGALKIHFYLDDPKRKKQSTHDEGTPPYDFLGGVGNSLVPLPFKTSSLKNGTHTITIKVDLNGGVEQVSTATFSIRNVPPKPRTIKATAGKQVVSVTWHNPGGGTVAFYVYRSSNKRVPLRHPVSGSRPLTVKAVCVPHKYCRFVDRMVKPGSRYYYVVQAVGSNHGRTSGLTVRSGTVKYGPFTVTTSVYGRNGFVQLAWSVHGVPAHIYIYRGVGTVNMTKPVKSLVGSARSWTDTHNIVNGTMYRYVVKIVHGTQHAQTTPHAVSPVSPPMAAAAAGTSAGVALSWAHGGAGVTSFAIYRAQGSAPTAFTLIKHVVSTQHTWTDPNALPGTPYLYYIQAVSLHGHAESGNTATVTHVPAPNPSSTAGDGIATVSWSGVGTGITGYLVYRSTSSSPSNILQNSNKIATLGITATHTDDNGLSNGTTFYYIVRALSDGGTSDSGVVSATPIVSPILSVVSINHAGDVTLSWTPSNDAHISNYKIYRGTSGSPSTPGSGSPSYASVGSGTHSWTDTNTNQGQTYYYVVQAWYGGGHAESNTTTAQPNAPAAVSGLTATPGFGSITLDWTSVDGSATGLEIYRSSDGSLGGLLTGLTWDSVAPLTYVDTTADPGTTYYYTVRTLSAGGYTDSDQVSAAAF